MSAGLLVAACACLVVVPSRALAAAPSLVASPDRGTLAASPVISGSCPAVDTAGGPVFPQETLLTLEGSGSGPWKVPLAADGTFSGFVAELSTGAAPGPYTFATQCGGSAPFSVLAAPVVRLDPARASRGATVLVTGSCPRRAREGTPDPGVFLDRRFLGTAPLDPVTGQFGPFSVEVPADAVAGAHQVSTSCGGLTAVAVLPPVVAPAPPGVVLVAVPDLRGRTEQQARAVLAGRLVLAGGAGGAGRIRSQDPAPGTRVRPGSTVHVVLAAAAAPVASGTPLRPLLTAAIGLLLLLLAAAVAISRFLRHRERRWVEGHVAVAADTSFLLLSDIPHQDVPGLDVALVVHRDSGPQFADTEVLHGRR